MGSQAPDSSPRGVTTAIEPSSLSSAGSGSFDLNTRPTLSGPSPPRPPGACARRCPSAPRHITHLVRALPQVLHGVRVSRRRGGPSHWCDSRGELLEPLLQKLVVDPEGAPFRVAGGHNPGQLLPELHGLQGTTHSRGSGPKTPASPPCQYPPMVGINGFNATGGREKGEEVAEQTSSLPPLSHLRRGRKAGW